MEHVNIDTLGLIIGQLGPIERPHMAILALYSTSRAMMGKMKALMATGWAQVLFDRLYGPNEVDNIYLLAIMYRWGNRVKAKWPGLYDLRYLLADDWAWLWPCFGVSGPNEIVELMLEIKRRIPSSEKKISLHIWPDIDDSVVSSRSSSVQYNSVANFAIYFDKSINYLAFKGHIDVALRLIEAYGMDHEYIDIWLVNCILIHERLDVFTIIYGRGKSSVKCYHDPVSPIEYIRAMKARNSQYDQYIVSLLKEMTPKMAKKVYGPDFKSYDLLNWYELLDSYFCSNSENILADYWNLINDKGPSWARDGPLFAKDVANIAQKVANLPEVFNSEGRWQLGHPYEYVTHYTNMVVDIMNDLRTSGLPFARSMAFIVFVQEIRAEIDDFIDQFLAQIEPTVAIKARLADIVAKVAQFVANCDQLGIDHEFTEKNDD
jgi:hypothetical protein